MTVINGPLLLMGHPVYDRKFHSSMSREGLMLVLRLKQ